MAITGPQTNTVNPVGALPPVPITSSHDKLVGILRGDVGGIRKLNPMVVNGPRLVNRIWRRLVEKSLKDGMTWEQIVKKILDYDLMIEKGKVTQQNILQRAAKKK